MTTERAKTEQITASIRWSIRRDLPQIVAIEQQSFDHPWSETEFLSTLRHRNVICLVADDGGENIGRSGEPQIYGFMVYHLHRQQFEIINLAVDPAYRRRGIASQLIRKLFPKLTYSHCERINAIVGDRSLGAHLFLKAMRFEAVDILEGHFEQAGQDGYEFEWRPD